MLHKLLDLTLFACLCFLLFLVFLVFLLFLLFAASVLSQFDRTTESRLASCLPGLTRLSSPESPVSGLAVSSPPSPTGG